jgi:hypothetical protein
VFKRVDQLEEDRVSLENDVGTSACSISKSWGAFYVVKRENSIVRVESLFSEQHYPFLDHFLTCFLAGGGAGKYISVIAEYSPNLGTLPVTEGPISPLSKSHCIAGLSYDEKGASYFIMNIIYMCWVVSLAL